MQDTLEGQTFGRLTVIKPVQRSRMEWLCRCVCGKEVFVQRHMLISGNTRSCGCLRKELARIRHTTHGHTFVKGASVEYMTWAGMIQRCKNPNHISYKHYGGKGIAVCERWKDFKNFLADMGLRPAGDFTIGRKDGLLGYSPENCQWEDRRTQARNSGHNRYITFGGKTQILQDWAQELGLNPSSLQERLQKWPLERALTEGKKRG